SQPELQHQVMIEAVENHMPEVIVIDEIGTELEALAARTIAERGVQLVGTAHGNQLANLIKNPTLSDLIGGIQSVTLGDEEMRRRGLPQKSILERKAQPTFDIAVEMWERYRWAVHDDVAGTIDMLLRDRDPGRQIRAVSDAGEVTTTEEKPKNPEVMRNPAVKGWRATGKIKPIPLDPQVQMRSELADLSSKISNNSVAELHESSDEDEEEFGDMSSYVAMRERFGTLNVYLYGVSRHQTEQVVQSINLPIEITKDLDEADIVLALRSQIRTSSKVRQVAEARQIPIHAIKTSTLPQITRALRRILHIDESPADTISDLNMFAYGDSEDEIEALEETRLAVEQIVIPKSQPVELLPRSSIIRRMQHELVEHYQLRSESYGSEPNRRLRIFPN
ncbi:MAG: R3H domain-containing nucleic acid-binding protein, partial [Pseudanabaena sp.]